MNSKAKLFAIAIAAIIVLSSAVVLIETVGTQTPNRPIRVACVGDSITEGSGYPQKLSQLLGDDYYVVNFGVSGSTVSLNSSRPYMFQKQFLLARNFKPDIVIIMLGTNDARGDIQQFSENFENDYIALVRFFQRLDSNPEIWVVKSPPIQRNSIDLSAQFFNAQIIPRIENVAITMKLSSIDVYGAFGDNPDLFMDGVHPNGDGAALIASTVYDAIVNDED